MSELAPPFRVQVFENSACERHFVGGEPRGTDYIVHGKLLYAFKVTWKPGGFLLFVRRMAMYNQSLLGPQ